MPSAIRILWEHLDSPGLGLGSCAVFKIKITQDLISLEIDDGIRRNYTSRLNKGMKSPEESGRKVVTIKTANVLNNINSAWYKFRHF